MLSKALFLDLPFHFSFLYFYVFLLCLLVSFYFFLSFHTIFRIIGIVVGTVNVNNYLQVVDRLKQLCKKACKRYYVLYVGKPNVAKLANFSHQMDLFVMLSCPYGIILEQKDFDKPILTPFEFEQACYPSGSSWMSGSGWSSSPSAILRDEKGKNCYS